MIDPYGDAALEYAALRTFKRMAIVGGLVSLAMGIMLLAWPEETLLVAAALLGVWLVLIGIFRIIEGVTSSALAGGMRALTAVVGLLYIVIGVILLRNLATSVTLLAVIIGLAWIVGGVAEIVLGFTRSGGWAKVGTVLLGLLSIAAGLVVFFWPGISLVVLIWITGLWLVVLGIAQLILGFTAHRGAKRAIPATPAGAT